MSDADSPSPRVPPEIIDAIIDNLHSDKATLRQCSLVSKAFLPSSRYHYFEVVTLTSRNMIGFLAILTAPGSAVSPYVRHLRLMELMQIEHPRERWLNKAFPALTALESVETLYMEGIIWRLVNSDAQKALLSSFKKLQTLSMGYTAFQTGADLAYVISAFPLLESISMEMVVTQAVDRGIVDVARDAPSRLRSIDFKSCKVRHYLDLCLSLGRIPAIESVRFMCDTPDQLQSHIAYIKALGSSLRSLRIVFSENIPGILYHDIDLSENTKLRSLHIDMSLLNKYARSFRPMRWVPTVLSRVVSHHIREISFTVCVNPSSGLDPADWTEIADSLAHPHFVCLERIHVLIGGDGSRYPGDVEDELMVMLSSCSTRGILHFHHIQ